MSIVLLAAVAAFATTPAVPDQTRDLVVLAQVLAAVKSRGDTTSTLARGAIVGDYAQRERSSFDAFAAYARGCELKQVRAVTGMGGKRMPIGVEWSCRYPEKDHAASFWFEGGKINRIGWGPPAVVRVQPAAR